MDIGNSNNYLIRVENTHEGITASFSQQESIPVAQNVNYNKKKQSSR